MACLVDMCCLLCRLDLSESWLVDARSYGQLHKLTHLHELVLPHPLPVDTPQVPSHCNRCQLHSHISVIIQASMLCTISASPIYFVRMLALLQARSAQTHLAQHIGISSTGVELRFLCYAFVLCKLSTVIHKYVKTV